MGRRHPRAPALSQRGDLACTRPGRILAYGQEMGGGVSSPVVTPAQILSCSPCYGRRKSAQTLLLNSIHTSIKTGERAHKYPTRLYFSSLRNYIEREWLLSLRKNLRIFFFCDVHCSSSYRKKATKKKEHFHSLDDLDSRGHQRSSELPRGHLGHRERRHAAVGPLRVPSNERAPSVQRVAVQSREAFGRALPPPLSGGRLHLAPSTVQENFQLHARLDRYCVP